VSLFQEMKKKKTADTITIGEFVRGIEDLSILKREYKEETVSTVPWRITLQTICELPWFRTVITTLVALHLWVLCLYGTFTREDVLDGVMIVLFVIYVVEVTVKIVAYTPGKYWYYEYYFLDERELFKSMKRQRTRRFSFAENADDMRFMTRREAKYMMFEHRYDAVLVYGCLAALVLTLLITGLEYPDRLRFIIALSILRLFTVVKRLRAVAFILLGNFSLIFPIMVVLLYVFLIYAVIGIALFAEKFALLEVPPYTNFDSQATALMSLFQVFSGQNWMDVMYFGINATSWSVAWYFMSFVLIATLLGANLLKAMFLKDV